MALLPPKILSNASQIHRTFPFYAACCGALYSERTAFYNLGFPVLRLKSSSLGPFFCDRVACPRFLQAA